MKKVTIKELSQKYNKSISYLNTILCRPEFNQFLVKNQIKKGGGKLFIDCDNLGKMLIFFINRKKNNFSIEKIKENILLNNNNNKNNVRWSPSAIKCYQRSCACKDCEYSLLNSRCRMKKTVLDLIRNIGIPQMDDCKNSNNMIL